MSSLISKNSHKKNNINCTPQLPTAASNQSKAPTYLSQNDISKLSDDPKNMVYTYTNDTPTALFTTELQKSYIKDIRNAYLLDKKNNPNKNDEEIRQKLKDENKEWTLFSENNTRIFETCTNKESTQDHINHIKYMLYLREQQERGMIDESSAQAMIQDYLIAKFKSEKTLEQYKAEMAQEKAEKKRQQQQQQQQQHSVIQKVIKKF